MPKSDKAKTAGKFAVVMLSLAILFFLLLPFLDNSEAAGGSGKKAVPQIFTSNPLSDLVRKIYSMFAKNQRAPGARGGQTFALAQGGPAYQATPGAGNGERYAAENDGKSGSSSVGASYDYGDAGIINEDGEWVLVRQTAPDAAQRGMHEINSSDTAYEKLMRLERAAKYTGRPGIGGPVIPDSKWARLWKPIKNFFTGESDAPEAADVQQAFALASASGGLGQDADKRGDSYARGQGMNIGAGNARGGQEGADPGYFALLNPEYALSGIVDNLNKLAEKELSGDDLKNFQQQTKKFSAEKIQEVRQAFLNKIAQDAEGKNPEELLENTHKFCGSGPSGLYSTSSSNCSGPVTPEQREQKDNEALKNQAESLAKLSQLAGKPLSLEDLNMIVILGSTSGTNPMETLKREYIPDPKLSEEENERLKEEFEQKDKLLKGFYDYMLKTQGCDKDDCFWVGGENQPDPSMRDRVISAGLNYDGDPLKLGDKFVKEYQQQAQAEGQENFYMLSSYLSQDYPAYYFPLNKKNMQELNARNYVDPNNPKKPAKPTLALFPTAANAKDVIDKGGWTHYGATLYGRGILHKGKATDTQMGQALNNMMIKQAKEALALINNAEQDVARYGLSVIMEKNSSRIKKDIQEQMGSGRGNVQNLFPAIEGDD